jgi:hypothetical protein
MDKTIQWPKAKGQIINNNVPNTSQKTNDRATRIPLKTWGELMCSGRVSSSYSTSSTCRVTFTTNPNDERIRRVPLVEHELLVHPEHMRSPLVVVLVAQSVVFSVVFCQPFFVFLSFFILTNVLVVLRFPGFWLLLCYPHTFIDPNSYR